MDYLLDFINSQHRSDDQLDQVLQTYQTYLTMYILRIMGSLIGLMIQLKDFNLITTSMNLMIMSTDHSRLQPKFHQLITDWLIYIPHNGD